MKIIVPRRIIFDTNVFVDATNGFLRKGALDRWILPADWRATATFVDSHLLHAITPITVVELLTGVDRGGDQYFEDNRAALRKVIYPFSARVFLPFIRYFIRREVFGMKAPYRPELEDDFKTVIEIVLLAGSKDALQQKTVPFKGQTAGIAFEKLRDERRQQEALWHNQAAMIKKASWNPTREGWAAQKLIEMNVPESQGNRDLLNERLDACYYWERRCFEMARDPNCKFERAQSLMMDANLLAYLAAPDIVFVTRDDEIVDAVRSSSQSDRILSWTKFSALIEQDRQTLAVGASQ